MDRPPQPGIRWSVGRSALAVPLIVALGLVCIREVRLGSEPRPAARRIQCTNNLKQIALALANYEGTYGEYPPPYSVDSRGRPLHSWRVLILPFLEHQRLYDALNLDEPWDGPHNGPILRSAPLAVYCCPADPDACTNGLTSYVAVVGPETLFPGGGRSRTRAEITDGTARTVGVVETANARIPWMVPRDLELAKLGPLVGDRSAPSVSGRHAPMANLMYCDGSVRGFPHGAPPPGGLRSLLTVAGGEAEPAP